MKSAIRAVRCIGEFGLISAIHSAAHTCAVRDGLSGPVSASASSQTPASGRNFKIRTGSGRKARHRGKPEPREQCCPNDHRILQREICTDADGSEVARRTQSFRPEGLAPTDNDAVSGTSASVVCALRHKDRPTPKSAYWAKVKPAFSPRVIARKLSGSNAKFCARHAGINIIQSIKMRVLVLRWQLPCSVVQPIPVNCGQRYRHPPTPLRQCALMLAQERCCQRQILRPTSI